MPLPLAGRALRRNLRRCALALTAILLVLAPAHAAQPEDAGNSGGTGAETYRIGASDTLNIDVRGEPRLSGPYAVRPDGDITLPLAGDVAASGTTPEALADVLEKRLAAYIMDPMVTVTVTGATGTFASRIRIIGSGVPPRSLPYREGMTALDAVISALGGLPETAAGNSAYLLRRVEGAEDRDRMPLALDDLLARTGEVANPELQPGDVMVIPEGFFAGTWQFEPFVTARQTYTDNVDLDPKGQEEAALITEVGPGVTLQGNMARLRAALNGSVRYERQSLNDAGNDVNADVAGNATAEWLENTLFTDASASISQQVLDSAGATSASGTNDANQETVQAYRVSPYLVNRLGRFARLETRYSSALTLISGDGGDRRFDRGGDDGASDTLQHTVSLTASSGPTFDRWSWTLRGSASELNALDDNQDVATTTAQTDRTVDTSRRDVVLQNQFAISRSLALTGDIGYQKLDSDDQRDSFESIRWAAGFRYAPSPDTLLAANAGEQNDDFSFSVEARHDISPRTTVSVTYREEVATGQERLVASLPGDVENIEDLRPEDIRFSLRDEITRTETLTGRFQTRFGRNDLSLTGSYETESEDAIEGESTEERIRFSATYGRALTRDVALNLSGSYANVQFSDVDPGTGATDVEDDVYDATIGLDYTGFERLSLGLQYSFSRRDSTRASDEFTENAVTFSGSYRF